MLCDRGTGFPNIVTCRGKIHDEGEIAQTNKPAGKRKSIETNLIKKLSVDLDFGMHKVVSTIVRAFQQSRREGEIGTRLELIQIKTHSINYKVIMFISL